ncbi:hypothetical protein [Nocardioides nitrophenolicus]|uniref:hypothetical protein n=1 Tax=Nocardioides nitrophenolicus TaxID=60489 RepID=UPI00195CF318|nr:hypothetical protein [Nocardioides nitrophenolicus]MBM7517833.1 hypothetical protein [Nocardioides nitrophenolicus]
MSDNYWTDRRQDRRIEEAEAQLDAERRARNRLAEQLRSQQGNTQAQFERLTRAFVALVEHEDTRSELGQYADAAAVRRYAREVVSTVVATGGAALRDSVEPADVPGYWLAAAARGVAASARGEAEGAGLLAEAARRDPGRTTLFLALLGALTRDPRWVAQRTDGALPTALTVTHAERQVWLAAADGRLPAPLTDALGTALAAQVAATGGAGPDEVAAWLEGRAVLGRDAIAAERASAQLEVLHQVLTAGGDAATPEPAEPDSEDPLADCLRSLVDEGSPGEADILDRMAVARADMGFLDERIAADAPGWNAAAGDVLSLLLADLAAPATSGRYTLARRALTPVLRGIAGELAQQAAVPAPETRTVDAAGEVLTVRADGAPTDWRERVTGAFDQRHPRNRRSLPIGLGVLGLGVACCLLGFVAGGFLLLGVLVGCVGGGLALAAVVKQRELDRNRAATLAGAEREIAREAAVLRDHASRSAAAASRAGELHRAVAGVLVPA